MIIGEGPPKKSSILLDSARPAWTSPGARAPSDQGTPHARLSTQVPRALNQHALLNGGHSTKVSLCDAANFELFFIGALQSVVIALGADICM